MIMGLYMALPVLKKITENGKLTKYFLLLSFIFAFVVPQIISYGTLKGEKAVVAVSKACFGVYLIHEAILIVIKSQLKFDMAGTMPALSIPVVMIIAFAVSLGMSLITGLIPGAKKYIV